jgi:hypothetical protein
VCVCVFVVCVYRCVCVCACVYMCVYMCVCDCVCDCVSVCACQCWAVGALTLQVTDCGGKAGRATRTELIKTRALPFNHAPQQASGLIFKCEASALL